MEVLTILEWLLAWGMLLFAQSVFINGVYQSATGTSSIRVDGSDEGSEMILFWLKRFFETIIIKKRKYTGLQLISLIDKIHRHDKHYGIWDNTQIKKNKITWLKPGSYSLVLKDLSMYYQSIYDFIVEPNGECDLIFYKEYQEYKYSKWLRKPIIQCIKCMSSFWGALTFWPIVLFIFGFHLLEIPIFFADVFSLTYLNWVLYKRAQ